MKEGEAVWGYDDRKCCACSLIVVGILFIGFSVLFLAKVNILRGKLSCFFR